MQENKVSHMCHHVGFVVGHLGEGVREPVLELDLGVQSAAIVLLLGLYAQD